MRTSNYRLNQQHTWSQGVHDSKCLPQGSYISPVKIEYVPKHIIEKACHQWFNSEMEIFCFTREGFVAIPKYKIREE